ncbi:MAG: methyl-accepting chemotaxis protein [Solirubrobacterales bacterium]
MKNLSIKMKVAGAFGVLLAIVLALSLYAINRLSVMDDLTSDIAENTLPSVNYAGALDAVTARFRVGEARHILAENDEAMRAMDKVLDERAQQVTELRAKYEPVITSSEERALYNEFVRQWDGYLRVDKELMALSRQHANAEAQALLNGESLTAFNRVADSLAALTKFNVQAAEAANRHAKEVYTFSRNLMVGAVAVTILMTIGMAIFLITNVSHPVSAMTRVMERLSNNDFAVAIPDTDRTDELGRMAQAVQVFKDKMEQNRLMEAEVKEAERRTAEQRKKDMNRLADQFEGSVKGVVNAVSSAATEMQASAQALSSVAEQTQRQSTSVAAAAEQATANVQTVAAATTELSTSISEIGRQVEVSSRVSKNAVDEAQRVQHMVTELSNAAQKIGDVVNLINDIASQTNLLALNATIEAARAGDAGKGFAVVANEVKSLANQTARATDEISQQISSVQGATREAVSAIQGITGTIGQIAEIAGSIAAAVEQQSAATQEIARNVQQAASGTQEVSTNIVGVNQASAETGSAAAQVLGAAQELSVQSEHLRADVDSFIASVRQA